MTVINAPDENDAYLVSPADACPRCGERDIDGLVWTEDAMVRCQSCGLEYDPNSTPRCE